jgi:hypothetical protein
MDVQYMRLKGNLDDRNFSIRLSYNPDILEFYLSEESLKEPSLIRERIRQLRERGTKAYLHHPPRFEGEYLDILSDNPGNRRYYQESCELLARICSEEGAKCIVHAHYVHTASTRDITRERTVQLRDAIREVLSYSRDVFVWEDSTEGLFAYSNPYLIDDLIAPLALPLNVDVSHAFIALQGDNDKLKTVLERTAPFARYFHLAARQRNDRLAYGEAVRDRQRFYFRNRARRRPLGLHADGREREVLHRG